MVIIGRAVQAMERMTGRGAVRRAGVIAMQTWVALRERDRVRTGFRAKDVGRHCASKGEQERQQQQDENAK